MWPKYTHTGSQTKRGLSVYFIIIWTAWWHLSLYGQRPDVLLCRRYLALNCHPLSLIPRKTSFVRVGFWLPHCVCSFVFCIALYLTIYLSIWLTLCSPTSFHISSFSPVPYGICTGNSSNFMVTWSDFISRFNSTHANWVIKKHCKFEYCYHTFNKW